MLEKNGFGGLVAFLVESGLGYNMRMVRFGVVVEEPRRGAKKLQILTCSVPPSDSARSCYIQGSMECSRPGLVSGAAGTDPALLARPVARP